MGGNGATSGKSSGRGFQSMGNGEWQLNYPSGAGAQILDESDPYKYGGAAYSVHTWDDNYEMITNGRVYDSLNAAKSAARQDIEPYKKKSKK